MGFMPICGNYTIDQHDLIRRSIEASRRIGCATMIHWKVTCHTWPIKPGKNYTADEVAVVLQDCFYSSLNEIIILIWRQGLYVLHPLHPSDFSRAICTPFRQLRSYCFYFAQNNWSIWQYSFVVSGKTCVCADECRFRLRKIFVDLSEPLQQATYLAEVTKSTWQLPWPYDYLSPLDCAGALNISPVSSMALFP